MTHEQAAALLGTYALGALRSPEEVNAVAAHLVTCAQCRREAAVYRAIVQQLRGGPRDASA